MPKRVLTCQSVPTLAAMLVVVLGLSSCTTGSKPQTAASENVTTKKTSEESSTPNAAISMPRETEIQTYAPLNQRAEDQLADGFLPAVGDEVYSMSGRIEKMGWTKSAESWNAGGSEYFVLVCDASSQRTSKPQRVILRTAPEYPRLDDFDQFAGRRVIVRGRPAGFVKVEIHPESQYPVFEVFEEKGADGKARLYTWSGGGFLVDSITVFEPVKPLEQK